MNNLICRQCGYAIVPVEFWKADANAQANGYCGRGCQEVAEAIRKVEEGRGKAA